MSNQEFDGVRLKSMSADKKAKIASIIEDGIKNGALKGTPIADKFTKYGGDMNKVIKDLEHNVFNNKGTKYAIKGKNGSLLLRDNNEAELAAIKKVEAADKALKDFTDGDYKKAKAAYNKAYSTRKNAYQAIQVNAMAEGKGKKRAKKLLDADVAETEGKSGKAKRLRKQVETADKKAKEAADKAAKKAKEAADKAAEKQRIKDLSKVKNAGAVAGSQSKKNADATERAMTKLGKASAAKAQRDAENALNKKYRADLNKITNELGKEARSRIDKDMHRERTRRGGRIPPMMFERAVKKELERQLRELNKQAGNGVSAQLNAELSRVKSQLARLTAANSSYSKRIKTLTESNKKLSRSVKSGKSASALEQQINHKNSFTGN